MTCRDQTEGCANAANMSAVWKHLKLQMQKSLQAPTARDCLLLHLHLMSPTRRGKRWWLLLVTVWWLKSRNGLKQLVNKLQNVMFSNTHTDCMYSNSAARARGTRVQSPNRKENQHWNSVTRQLLCNIFIHHIVTMWCVQQTPSQIYNEKKRSTEVFLGVSAKIKAPSTFINDSIVILLFFCKIK